MSEAMNFAIAGILPTNTTSKSKDPVGDDVVKITEEFAKLLIAQISNQDPDKPQDITETVTQYSQMLATLGQVKANNALVQFGQVQIGSDVIGKQIKFREGTTVMDGKQVDILRSGIVTAVDFSTDAPKIYVEGYPTPVDVKEIRVIEQSNQMASVQSGAQLVGKTVSYIKYVANPAYPGDGQPNPANEPAQIAQEFTGIVTQVDFTKSSTPQLGVSGEPDPVSLTMVSKIFN